MHASRPTLKPKQKFFIYKTKLRYRQIAILCNVMYKGSANSDKKWTSHASSSYVLFIHF